jgi:tRNA(adenine34) deaminase
MIDAAAAERWMRVALAEARGALDHDDVPVGAVVVAADGTELARGHNRREQQRDPTAHAELEALRAAAKSLGAWRLDGCTLVVTLEPCAMCAGALVQARVAGLVFGADDPRAGAVTSLFDLVRDPRLPHRVEVRRGVLADDCAALLRAFFAARR